MVSVRPKSDAVLKINQTSIQIGEQSCETWTLIVVGVPTAGPDKKYLSLHTELLIACDETRNHSQLRSK